MNKAVRIVLLGEAEKAFRKLNEIVGRQIEAGKENTDEMQLFKSIKQKIDFIKANPFYGDPVAKKLIPQEYKTEHGAVTLFRVELSGYWNALHSQRRPRRNCRLCPRYPRPSYV